MKGIYGLLSINVSGKITSIVLFAVLARLLTAEHLAFVGLIPSLAGLALAAFGFGVGTLLERDVPRLLVSDPEQANMLQRAGFLIASSAVLTMTLAVWLAVDVWTGVLLADYTFDRDSIRWISLPIAGYMFTEINAWMMVIRGKVRLYTVFWILGDIAGKVAVLAFYLWRPSELSLFLGLALGQLPCFVAALWVHRDWLYSKKLASPVELIRASRVYYAEANFIALRDRGDNVLVSSILGPVSLANFYVAKSVSAQLSLFFSPIFYSIIPLFSSRLAHGKEELGVLFKKAWVLAVPSFVWLAASLASISPFVLAVIAGPAYAHNWPTSMVLCFVAATMGMYELGTRALLVMGRSYERFRVVVIEVSIVVAAVLVIRDTSGTLGIAFAWLIAAVATFFVVRARVQSIGFQWPRWGVLLRAIALCVPVPLLMLYGVGYGPHPDWLFLVLACVLSGASLLGLWLLQDPFESQQLAATLPPRLLPAYNSLRRLAGRA